MHRLALTAATLLFSASTLAETLLVDRAQRGRSAAVPNRGLTMASVESQYGAPVEKFAAVGRPPITRWVYPAFTVYFEHDHVVHAVVNRSSAQEIGPKPAD